jgi:hypothetical protein
MRNLIRIFNLCFISSTHFLSIKIYPIYSSFSILQVIIYNAKLDIVWSNKDVFSAKLNAFLCLFN